MRAEGEEGDGAWQGRQTRSRMGDDDATENSPALRRMAGRDAKHQGAAMASLVVVDSSEMRELLLLAWVPVAGA